MDLAREIRLVINMSMVFPRIARGHGSRKSKYECSAVGCKGLTSESHFQNRHALAVEALEERGVKISRTTRIVFGVAELNPYEKIIFERIQKATGVNSKRLFDVILGVVQKVTRADVRALGMFDTAAL